MNTLAVVLAGGRGRRLSVLSQDRTESAVPFAGKYRIIDFVLSNCVNSGIFDVGILTQYQPHSLNNHIRTGRPWDLDRTLSGGVTLLPPYQRQGGSLDWYHGTADAVYQNLDFIQHHKTDTVLVLSGDQVYKMDYEPLVCYHRQRRADVTVCVIDVPPDQASQFGILSADEDGCVTKFEEKPRQPSGTMASMGVYVFRTNVLVQRLTQDARLFDSSHDFGTDVLPRMLELGDRFYAYPFQGYWIDVDTVETYWEAHMDLLRTEPRLDLQDPHWRVRTRSEERPPVDIGAGAVISNSLVTNGCAIRGRVENSVLSSGVRVGPGAFVRDSIIFNDCVISSGAVVDRAILDKDVVVGENASIGVDEYYVPDFSHLVGLISGITLVGRNTHLPADLRIGRNCIIPSGLAEDDFLVGSDQEPDPALEPVRVAPAQHKGRPETRTKRTRWNRSIGRPSAVPVTAN